MKTKKQIETKIEELKKQLLELEELKKQLLELETKPIELKLNNKKVRIYRWEDKPFNEFKSPKGFRVCEFKEVNELIELGLIKYSGKYEVFLTKHFNKLYQDKWLSRLYLSEDGVDSNNDNLAVSYSSGRVVVIEK